MKSPIFRTSLVVGTLAMVAIATIERTSGADFDPTDPLKNTPVDPRIYPRTIPEGPDPPRFPVFVQFVYINSHGQHGFFVDGGDGFWYEVCDNRVLGKFRLKERLSGNVTLVGVGRSIAIVLPVSGPTGKYWMNGGWVPSADWRIVARH